MFWDVKTDLILFDLKNALEIACFFLDYLLFIINY